MNLENYLLDLSKENKEQYINESVKLFKYHNTRISSLLKFVKCSLYDSNEGNINILRDSIYQYKKGFY